MQVDIERGTLRTVTTLDAGAGDRRHVRPMAVPDGRHFVHLAQRKDGLFAMLASVGGPRAIALGSVESHVLPTRSGHALFVRDGILRAQKLDLAAGRLVGDATILAHGLTTPVLGRTFDGRFSASSDMLVYFDWKVSFNADAVLAIFDAAGRRQATVGEPAGYFVPTFSPDGSRLAVSRSEVQSPYRDIWVFDLTRGTRLRLTLEGSDETVRNGPPTVCRSSTRRTGAGSVISTSDSRPERGRASFVFESEISKM